MHNITVTVPGYEHVGVNYNSDWSGTAHVLFRPEGGHLEHVEIPAPVLRAFMVRKAEATLERVIAAVRGAIESEQRALGKDPP